MRQFLDMDRRLAGNLAAMERNRALSSENKREIRSFAVRRASEGLSPATTSKLVSNFQSCIARFAPSKTFSLRRAKEAELRELVMRIDASTYACHTKAAMKQAIKQYYKSIGNPERASFIKAHMKKKDRKLPCESDLLSPAELESMIRTCKSSRDKALISLLAESGARIGEIGSLQVQHVVFDKNGVILHIPQGKTGPRRIRLVECERHLRNWLLEHPTPDQKDAWLWINLLHRVDTSLQYERMNYAGVRAVILRSAIAAGVKTYKTTRGKTFTRVHPHLFRHTAATRLAKHLTEQQLKVYFGWTPGSDMASVYVHMSGKDVDNAILKMHGLQTKESVPQARRCPACGHANPQDGKLCGQCFRPLTTQAAVQLDREERHAERVWDVILRMQETIENLQREVQKR